MSIELILTRDASVAGRLEELIRAAKNSIDAALYRFNQPRLAEVLAEAVRREIRVRVVLDRSKYEESRSTRDLFSNGEIPFRLAYGREGPGSKMHHKFAILDGRTALTGSYNWTIESEEQNLENLLIIGNLDQVALYQKEFETLWAQAVPPQK
jgi:phosphatidylserine/phosphatidylglycerophosphate/cardiolipin synthase-like enzyme